jgi:hypothetical protein
MSARDASTDLVVSKLLQLFDECVRHEGYADLHVEMRILSRGQKEVILHFGRQHRYVIDMPRRMPLTPVRKLDDAGS